MLGSRDLLARLVAFPSVSSRSNRDVADFIVDHLGLAGIRAERFWSADGAKANIFATIGPAVAGGIILSGHMDVVPTTGQHWTSDPFQLRDHDGRLYGRGAADMKGFLACVLSLADRVRPERLRAPIHLCFSYDEEVGCVGVRPMLDELATRALGARLCIVGEPTGLRVVTGHKGKLAATAICRGVSAHSAMAPLALNAIHLAADLLGVLRATQDRLAQDGARDPAYDVPTSTVHAGVIAGGNALNIVPDLCTMAFEIRTVAPDDASAILARITAEADGIAARARASFPAAGIVITQTNAYPGLATPSDGPAAAFVAGLVGQDRTGKVAFGTEGGLFAEKLGIPVVVCGPGSMEQGHTADEYIAREQLDRCDAALDRLAASLSS